MTISPPERGEKAKGVPTPWDQPVEMDHAPVDYEKLGKPGFFSSKLSKGPKTTTWIWNLHADAHDFDTHLGDLEETSRKIFSAHFGHLAVVFIWMSGAFFHGARFSNYSGWLTDPTHVKPSAQVLWPIVGQEVMNGDVGGGFHGLQITSGIFQMWRSWGITSETQLMALAIGGVVMAALMLHGGIYHYHKSAPKLEWFQKVEPMLQHHQIALIGLGSIAWAGHCIHIGAPVAAMLDAIDAGKPLVVDGVTIASAADVTSLSTRLCDPQVASQIFPSLGGRTVENFFTLNWWAFSDILTNKGGLNPVTGSLWMTDISHHHLAWGVFAIFGGHMWRNAVHGVGHSMKEIMDVHTGDPILFPAPKGHQGIFEFLSNSWHGQLSINLAMVGSGSIVIAHHMYALPAYPYLSSDYPTVLGLFTHHMWIGGLMICGAAAHGGIAMIRDYDPALHIDNVLDRILKARDAIISHLNWVCMWLGFHSFGLYIHNDVMRALGRPKDMFSDTGIQLQPFLAQWVQNLWQGSIGTSELVGTPNALPGGVSEAFSMPLGTADLMIHHVHAFTIHVTLLILLKGVLYARSSRLIPDKAQLGFRFPCDGPGRGGTCQVSSWDHVFLGLFWMYNSLSVVIFYFSWKMQSDVWGLTGGNFAQSSITINGWLRDFLWAQSSQVLTGYGEATAGYSLLFLGAHFIWAFSLMFLFTGRGYWQELFESILWAHNKLKLAPTIQPRALSITQGRAVGVTHFLLGGIVTTWAFFHARLIGLG
jgi:photosystem I P700 chlorophyll a apoprotein A1